MQSLNALLSHMIFQLTKLNSAVEAMARQMPTQEDLQGLQHRLARLGQDNTWDLNMLRHQVATKQHLLGLAHSLASKEELAQALQTLARQAATEATAGAQGDGVARQGGAAQPSAEAAAQRAFAAHGEKAAQEAAADSLNDRTRADGVAGAAQAGRAAGADAQATRVESIPERQAKERTLPAGHLPPEPLPGWGNLGLAAVSEEGAARPAQVALRPDLEQQAARGRSDGRRKPFDVPDCTCRSGPLQAGCSVLEPEEIGAVMEDASGSRTCAPHGSLLDEASLLRRQRKAPALARGGVDRWATTRTAEGTLAA